MPTITPNATGQTSYTITGSKGLVADLRLDIDALTPRDFTVTYPTAEPVTITLVLGGTSKVLLPGPPLIADGTFAGRSITTSTTPSGPNTILTCTIAVTAGSVLNEAWRVRGGNANSINWQFGQTENNPGDLTITRIMSDPVAGFTIAPGSPVLENDSVTLTPVSPFGPPLTPTVVGAPAPAVNYLWEYTGDVAITSVPTFPNCTAAIGMNFTAPGVYGSKTISITERVWFEGGCPTIELLNATSAAQNLTINPRPQYLMLVLDRSGSMAGTKWENAKLAGRILGHLFGALRSGVNGADRVGILVFEDAACSWHMPPVSPLIAPVLALSDANTASNGICGLAFGPAGACTPIGDALIKAMDMLGTLPSTGSPRYNVILLTDGFENAGSVRVGSAASIPAFVSDFAVARTGTPQRAQVNANLRLFAVGLGATVDGPVLDALPLPPGAGAQGTYRQITDVADLAGAIGEMVSYSQGAGVLATAAAPVAADPAPLAQQRYFSTEGRVNRLALAVKWANPADTLTISRRAKNTADAFVDVAPSLRQCDAHGFASVDVASLFPGGEPAVTELEWRVVHTSGGAAQAIPATGIMVWVDLFVRAEITFDRDRYTTGDPMVITAVIRAGNHPVPGATIKVELARPGESLGTFLSQPLRKQTQPGRGAADPNAPKPAHLVALLNQRDLADLPLDTPASIFTDGSNQLFDDGAHRDGSANDGNYANTYDATAKEGAYTWRFTITGNAPGAGAFNRVITVSKWVDIQIDPIASIVAIDFNAPAPAGLRAAAISVNPRSRTGELLGPFREHDVRFIASAGTFQGPLVSHLDGTYSRTLIYSGPVTPVVTIEVQGKTLPPAIVATGCIGWLIVRIQALLKWLIAKLHL